MSGLRPGGLRDGEQTPAPEVRQHPQARIRPVPDPLSRSGRADARRPETYERKSDAERALALIEAQVISGEWADSDRSKIKLQDYAAYWIAQRAGLRPRTVDLYTWLCAHQSLPRRGTAGQADHTDDPRMASEATARRCVGLHGSQGIPAAPLDPYDRRRRGQDPPSQSV